MILGIDFIRMFDIETRREQTGEPRSSAVPMVLDISSGKWNGRIRIFAECAGICAVDPREREKLNNLVETILGAEEVGKELPPYSSTK